MGPKDLFATAISAALYACAWNWHQRVGRYVTIQLQSGSTNAKVSCHRSLRRSSCAKYVPPDMPDRHGHPFQLLVPPQLLHNRLTRSCAICHIASSKGLGNFSAEPPHLCGLCEVVVWHLWEQVVHNMGANVMVDLVEDAIVAVDGGEAPPKVAPLLHRGARGLSHLRLVPHLLPTARILRAPV